MTYEDLQPFRDKRVFFEVLPAGGSAPLLGEGKIVELDETQVSISTEGGPGAKSGASGVIRHALAEVVSIQPA